MVMPDLTSANPASAWRAIENLISTYAERVDEGAFAAVGKLPEHAVFTGVAGSVSGSDLIEETLRDNMIVYEDGTPRTKHVVTNIAIEVDEEAETASARSYFTVLQALPTFRCRSSLAASTSTASSGTTGIGASQNGASKRISSAT
jgi:hypothetical protein